MENAEENTGEKKLIFGISIVCFLAIIVAVGYYLIPQKKPAPGIVTNQVDKNLIPVVSPSLLPPKFSDKQEVSVGKQGFDPAILKIKAGTLVKWLNQSGQEVAIVSDPLGTHDAYPGLNLGRFPNGSGVSAIFNKAGTYGYYNYLHPEQKGTIIVEQ